MILQVMILLLGFVLLVKGADWFVEGAASIARKLGIPQLIVGLTIVAMGTSMPEAAVSITAALNYHWKCNWKQHSERIADSWNYSSDHQCRDSEINVIL